jgi:ribonuclease BN (tRNA processing enzyme)
MEDAGCSYGGCYAVGSLVTRSTSLGVAAVLFTLSASGAFAEARAVDPPALELVVLGSGGPGATGRASSSHLVLLDGEPRILVDAGSGAFVRMGESKLSLDSLDVILLTHLHVDHAAELPGIIKARAVSAGRPIAFQVVGPRGRPAHGDVPAFPSTTRFMDLLFGPEGAFAYLKDFAAPVSFEVTEVPSSGSAGITTVKSADGLKISAIPGHHGDAPAVIYRLDYRGHSIVFSGDIDPAALPALGAISQGADLLVCNAVVLDPPGSPAVLYELHSPPNAIGPVAAAARVRVLLLSHLSPAVEGHRDAVSASLAAHFHGAVKYAGDGMHVVP